MILRSLEISLSHFGKWFGFLWSTLIHPTIQSIKPYTQECIAIRKNQVIKRINSSLFYQVCALICGDLFFFEIPPSLEQA